MIAALLLLAVAGTPDLRVELIEMQLAGRSEAALERVEAALRDDPAGARALGLDYLQGHLLEEVGRPSEAHRAFVNALNDTTELAAYSLYRLSLNESRMGHPEVAAGLMARLLANGAPKPLVRSAAAHLAGFVAQGGDCRLLTNLATWNLPAAERRPLELTAADCALAGDDAERGTARLLRLIGEGTDDEAARGAAERIDARFARLAQDTAVALELGRTFHSHRQFELSVRYLQQALGTDYRPLRSQRELDALYELARSHFWQGDYLLAASRFGQLASLYTTSGPKAKPLYQQGRSYELHGNWDLAANSFRLAYLADPVGDWAGPSLVASMRLAWRTGDEPEALELYELLTTRRSWSGLLGRAALFLAASDIVRGRSDRARGWLDDASHTRGSPAAEIGFWRGRLAELEGDPAAAVAHYAKVLPLDAFDPIADAARSRLARPALAAATVAHGRRLAGSRHSSEIYAAWLLLGDGDPAGEAARGRLEARAAADPRARVFRELRVPPAADWPMWRATLSRPEERLAALGIWSEAAPVMLQLFPVDDVALGFTGSQLLARAGANRQSLYIAEILAKRVPSDLPEELLAAAFRKLLYPLPYRREIERQAARQGVDRDLLAAIIREESRFDPLAVSAASARGLTQFVLPTAQRLAGRLGIERLRAADLHSPEVSIALGAAYLADLGARFPGEPYAAIAAYNAGESQAELWRSYCYSRQPEEYYTKVGFSETRRYLAKVVRSRNQYRGIYAAGD